MGRFWDPAGSPKSTKNGPGSEKVRPETAPEAIFVVFSRRCRSEWLSGPIFGGSDPPKLCSHHSGSTILTKSPFSKKHRKSSLRGPVSEPEIAENRRRRPKNRQNWRKTSIFWSSVFSPFFGTPKKTKKVRKRTPGLIPPEGFGGLAGPGGEVRRGNPSGTGGRPNWI